MIIDLKKEKSKRKTAGELSLQASLDNTKYNSMDVAFALTKDIEEQLYICADRHNHIFNEDRYCIGYTLAEDPIIRNLMRRKFYAMLYLPSPRPSQSIFLYDKPSKSIIKRLWTLPNAATMAELSECTFVSKGWRQMKGWCDAFYALNFWPYIRKESEIDMLSETEYLNANRKELVAARNNQIHSLLPEPFDPVKSMIDQVINSNNIIVSKNSNNRRG